MRIIDKKLFEACREGSLSKVENLLTKKIFRPIADCNSISDLRNYSHETPLMTTNNLEIIKLLIHKGADINKKVIYYEGGKKFDDNALYTHCCRKNIEIIKYLITHGANVNETITRFNSENNSILSLFVADDNADEKNLAIVQLLVNHGADVNVRNGKGLTPLDLVQKHGIHQLREVTEKIRLFLLENGAECSERSQEEYDVSVLNKKLIEACNNNRIDEIKELISKGANINAQPFGITPLIAACKNGLLEIVRFLVNNGADVNQKDFRHDSPLKYAISWERQDVARFLLDNGALMDSEVINNRIIHTSIFSSSLKCPYCSQLNRSNQWPLHGDRTSFYIQKEAGHYNLPLKCPHCNKEWFVVWDEEPGIIKVLDI